MKRTTTPLAKSYVTLEGWVTILANIALVATPIVTSSLSATQAAKYGAVINGVYILSRALVKASAAKTPAVAQPSAAPATTDELEAGPTDEDVMEPEQFDEDTWQAARAPVPETTSA